jgi:hypothetical protein
MNLNTALVYVAFFGLIALAIQLTGTAHCLWALLLCPSYKTSTRSDDSNSSKEM